MSEAGPDPESDEVQRRFRERAARDRERLAALWRTLAESREDSAADPRWREIEDIAHGLYGAGGTFGYPAISRAAATLERHVAAQPRRPAALARAIAALLRVLGEPPDDG